VLRVNSTAVPSLVDFGGGFCRSASDSSYPGAQIDGYMRSRDEDGNSLFNCEEEMVIILMALAITGFCVWLVIKGADLDDEY